MLLTFFRRLPRPKSLRRQFTLALSGIALLIVAGGLTAIYTLRVSTEATRKLSEERLVQMQDAQDLVQRSLLIEYKAHRMLTADSPAGLHDSHAGIVEQLEELDQLVERLGSASNDLTILALHQSGQLIRNTAHIVAQLRESTLESDNAFEKSLHKRTVLLLQQPDPATLGLTVLLYRLRDETRLEEIEALRNQFVVQASAAQSLPRLLAEDLQGLRIKTSNIATENPVLSDPFSQRQKLIEQQEILHYFHGELQHQAVAMVTSAHNLSNYFTEDYRESVKQLADTSQKNQRWVLGLLTGSLILAWLLSHFFLGQHVLIRLQTVSDFLRKRDTDQQPAQIPVHGNDEIGEMARAVEQFMDDSRLLAKANRSLETEKMHQAELIKRLAETQDQLLQAEKMASIGQLAAGVAHEINNPIGFVHSNLGSMRHYIDDLLRMLSIYQGSEGELTEETRATLTEFKQQVDIGFLREDIAALLCESTDGLQRVKRIVQALRDFSCVEESEKQWANLEEGLDSTLAMAWHEIKDKAEVVKEYGGIPEIECMPSQINQVFMNLLVNAAHAIAGHGRIILRTGQEEQKVWVEIEDSGTGIKAENLGRIFDPFFTTKDIGQGTGLGLSLSYSIIRNHGGHISVKSEVGTGSLFRVTLPIRHTPNKPTPGA